ncbi:MAG: type II and III secretion system protein family protein [Hyphomicrobiaceae bacterium]|nr:type II and III secretion system protein family protein [Hyphomicrobiaceae bacterium]
MTNPSAAIAAAARLLAAAIFVLAAAGTAGAAGKNNYGRASANIIGAHQSLLRIPEGAQMPVRKNVRVGLGKSVLVEFPREIRDVMVSNPQAIDAVVLSSNRVFLLARRIGEANAFFFGADGEQMATFELFVERETAGLEDLLNRIIPSANIKVEMLNQTVILTGSVRNPSDSVRASNIAKQFVTVEYETKTAAEAEGAAIKSVQKDNVDQTIINMLQVEGEEQVMLRVLVAEVQRSVMKQFGINLGAAINSGSFSTTLLTQNALPLTAAAGLGTLPIPGVNLKVDDNQACGVAGMLCNYNGGPGADAFGNNGVSGGWGSNSVNVTHAMRALERNGLVRTLAEPNLTAISGETAKFLAGGEYPIPVVDSLGKLSVTYKEFGVAVAFTPTVLSEGRISLKIETEVSELTTNGAVTLSSISIPALKKRQAKSTVELPSGGSLALAGLLSDDTRQNIDGFPGLKDLPVLGTLFRSRDFIKQETELVVMVTPYLVRPTAASQLARPLDGLASASDRKASFLGQINQIYGRGTEVPVGDLKGDYGFIVE